MSNIFDNVMLEDFSYMTEGDQADAYRARKEDERGRAELEDEAKYRKRYGDRKTVTTLRGDDLKPDVWWDRQTSGSVDHSRVKQTKKMTPQQKYEHDQKYTRDFEKAHLDVSRDAQKRDFNRRWGDDSKVAINTKKDMARAADAKARHDRRHPKNESVEFLLSKYEPEYYY